MHFTKTGIYQRYSPQRHRVRWNVSWGWLRQRMGFCVYYRYGLTDGSGERYKYVHTMGIEFLRWGVDLHLAWGTRPHVFSGPVRSFSDAMRDDPNHPIHREDYERSEQARTDAQEEERERLAILGQMVDEHLRKEDQQTEGKP